PDARRRRPGYRLPASLADSIQHYLLAMLQAPQPEKAADEANLDGRFVLAERNCLSCHARDAAPGLAERLAGVVALDQELAAQLPALAPPALNGVGDKLHEEWLLAAIESRQPLRPWLHVRMPRFRLDAGEK